MASTDTLTCPACREKVQINCLRPHMRRVHGIPERADGTLWYCVCGLRFDTAEERAEHFREHGKECMLTALLVGGP